MSHKVDALSKCRRALVALLLDDACLDGVLEMKADDKGAACDQGG
jgi:hypothetical protein